MSNCLPRRQPFKALDSDVVKEICSMYLDSKSECNIQAMVNTMVCKVSGLRCDMGAA
jgi:hypothetical protein